MSTRAAPRAFLTDVFGTVVDWRSVVVKHLAASAHEALNSQASSIPSVVRVAVNSVDWDDFAQQWRSSYYQFCRNYDPDSGKPFKSIDVHFLESLISLVDAHSLTGLWTEPQLQEISMIWHFLDPWPDSANGLKQLNEQGFETATLSNGNTSLLKDLASYGKLPYQHIISAEDFGAYKPHPSVYKGAAEKLGLQPRQCALVAAHLNDLQAARECGFQTVYIERHREEQWPEESIHRVKQSGGVDIWIKEDEGGFEELARRLKNGKWSSET